MNGGRRTWAKHRSAQLLPGIPDDITIEKIAPKLPWTTVNILPCVSKSWLDAIRRQQVYNARVRSHATETLLLVNLWNVEESQYFHEIALYSIKDDELYVLPPITAGFNLGIPQECQCVALEGRVYVLGGVVTQNCSDEVYVFDMFGKREWKPCAHMLEPRENFACAVMQGKIYVFGGSSDFEFVRGSEVYDPQKDTWSPIRPMQSLRFDHQVVARGEELIVHGGQALDPDYFKRTKRRLIEDGVGHIKKAKSLEIYRPVQDDWRAVEQSDRQGELLFLANGKFHSISDCAIHVHGVNGNSWTHLHSFSLPVHGEGFYMSWMSAVQVVDDELFAVVDWLDAVEPSSGTYLARSEGFGGQNKEILWRKVQFALTPSDWPMCIQTHFMCPIAL